jgi:hypothetical protein
MVSKKTELKIYSEDEKNVTKAVNSLLKCGLYVHEFKLDGEEKHHHELFKIMRSVSLEVSHE